MKRDIIAEILDEVTEIQYEQTRSKMLIAKRLYDAIKSKGWNNKDLLKAMNKNNPSVVSKWLSGTHNFTIDTLVELEQALNVKLLRLEETKPKQVKEYEFVLLGCSIESQNHYGWNRQNPYHHIRQNSGKYTHCAQYSVK